MNNRKTIIAVIGGHECNSKVEQLAQKIGENIAKVGAILVCGGLGGVMEAAARGAKKAGGVTVGILPGTNKRGANQYIDITIPTGLGHARNALVVRTADAVIALPGEEGTLSEIAFALIFKKPVIGLNAWDIPGVIQVKTAEEALDKMREHLKLNAA